MLPAPSVKLLLPGLEVESAEAKEFEGTSCPVVGPKENDDGADVPLVAEHIEPAE